MKKTFVILSMVVFLFFVWQLWKDYNRPYLSYQKEFRELLIKEGGVGQEIADFQLGVRQRWIEKLNRVDRCETCHLGIEDPRFKDAPQPFKTHPDADMHIFEKFGCTVCHGGQGLATSLEDAHGPTENWNRAIYHENFMQNSCSLCHGDFIQEESPVLSKGRKMFNEYGCRGCHKVKGEKRVKVGPPLKKMGEKIKIDWLYRWLKDPEAYLPQTKMPDFRLSEQEAADIALFLIPRIKPKETVQSIGGSYEQGEQLFRESRCVTCHSIEGRGGNIGPDLAKISSKVNPDWLFQWIKDPQELFPGTQMSIFGFVDQDVRHLVAFLVEEYIDLELEEDQVAQDLNRAAEGNVHRGKELIEKYGCTGCHEIEGVEDPGEIGLELTTIGDIHISRLNFGEINVDFKHRTVPNWLYNKMKTPRLFEKELKMPDYNFSDMEAEAMTTYLLSLEFEEVPASYVFSLGTPPSEYNPQGEFGKILKKRRCLVCHKINGRGGELAPDLSQEGSRVKKEWLLRRFMKKPYAIRPILVERMLKYKMSDSEIETLYAYFWTTLVDDRVEKLSGIVNEMSLDDPKLIHMGKKLYYEKYACNACHQINLKGGTIGPDLTDVGNRLNTKWIVYYLRDPKAFVKRSVEPVFKLTDKEIEALTAFMVNLKEKE